jgi:hypothetical protein
VVPSQVPPQAVASDAQAVRAPCGAPATGEQVPADPAASQASHWPPQAALQQTPSTQNPLAHWPAAPQGVPLAPFGVQTPAEHHWPAAHWSSAVQSPLQAVAPQVNAPQSRVWTAAQLPVPAQRASSLATPDVQEAARHTVVSMG